MRFQLEMKLDKPEFVKDYRKVILSFIKQVLSQCNDGKYLEEYFHDTVQKDYCFTALFQSPVFSGNSIQLADSGMKIRFSTDDRSKTGLKLMSGFIKQKGKSFSLPEGNHMILEKVRTENHTIITNSKVIFKTAVGGGLCIREHNRENNKDKFYTVHDSHFLEQANLVLRNQAAAAGFTKRVVDSFQITPIQCKKILILNYGIYVDASVGMFEAEGDSRLLQYFYDAGMGSHKSAGFGMVDFITQDME